MRYKYFGFFFSSFKFLFNIYNIFDYVFFIIGIEIIKSENRPAESNIIYNNSKNKIGNNFYC